MGAVIRSHRWRSVDIVASAAFLGLRHSVETQKNPDRGEDDQGSGRVGACERKRDCNGMSAPSRYWLFHIISSMFGSSLKPLQLKRAGGKKVSKVISLFHFFSGLRR
jgi:hypothetical protein